MGGDSIKKVIKIIVGFIVTLIVIVAVIFAIISLTSKKLVCKSSEGDITIMYNNKTITGYTAKGMTYDLDEQKEYAEQIGVEKYLDEFSTFFSTNTTGTCTKK